MLAALLLAGMVAAPLSSIALFTPAHQHARTAGAWPATRRFALAVLGTAVLAAAVAGALRLLNVSQHNLLAGLAGVVFASLVWLPVTRQWNARAHLAWASTLFLFVVYLTYALEWTFQSHLGAASTVGGVVLWLFEVFAAILSCAYLWEICDALGTEQWRRRITPDVTFQVDERDLPMISLHVPAHNEPPGMVIDTLRSLLRSNYPRYEVILIDDNTDDEALWRPVEAWCARHDVKFAHLADWPGYKSGALNYALRELTDSRAELIGVVDSDYQIEPGFLRRCAPAFADPWTGFVQAPQDYRDWQYARYYRRLYYSYKYFFAVSQPSRNEHNGAIFAGTMGLIRRVALDELGGWDEWCITEDAELSLRLLRAGWSGLHLDQSWGYGIMPLTFEALKGQRYRWCFGGIQILRMHWRSLLPARKTRENHLSLAQRWAYLAGGLQWYGDLLGLIFLVFLLAGAANLALGGGELFRKLTTFLVATVPVLVILGLVRAVALLRQGTGASWRDALGAFFIWQSTSLVVARASVLGLFARKAAFLRTPKTSEQAKWWEALRANWAETTLAVLGFAGIAAALSKVPQLSGILLAALLLFPTLGMAAAPVNSWAAQRAALPQWLRDRRTSEFRRDRSAFTAGVATGGLVAVLGVVVAAAVLLLTPSNHPVTTPNLVGPAQGSTAATPAASPSASPTQSSPSPTPSTAPATTPAPTPTTAPASPSPTVSVTAPGSPTAASIPLWSVLPNYPDLPGRVWLGSRIRTRGGATELYAAGSWRRVAFAMFAVAWGANQFSPLLVSYRHELRLSAGVEAALFAIYAATLIPGLLVGGLVSDRVGRRPAVIPFLVASPLATTLLMDGGHSLPLLAAGRALSGLCSGVVFGSATAWVQELSPNPAVSARRAAVALSAGFGSGPAVASALAQWAPDPLVLPYLPHVVIALLAIAVIWRAPETVTASPARRWPPRAVRSGRFWRAVAPAGPWVFGSLALAFVVLPQEASGAGGVSVGFAGLVTSLTVASGIAVQPLARWIEARLSLAGYVAGLGFAVVAAAGAAVAATYASRAAAIGCAIGFGLAYGLCLVSGLRECERLAGEGEHGAVVACYYALSYVGFGAPYLVAALNGPLGRVGALGVLAIAAAVTAMWATTCTGIASRTASGADVRPADATAVDVMAGAPAGSSAP